MFKLYDYQQKIVNESREALRTGRGAMIVSPPGSGKSIMIGEIARLTTARGNRVLFTVHRQELIDQINDTFNAMGVDMSLVTLLTIGKVRNRLNTLPDPRLIIVDESQHAKAKSYEMMFEHWPNVPRLGFSGSPWRMSGAGFDDVYSSMIEGPSVKWLIEHKRLAPFTYYAPQTLQGFKKKRGDFDKQSIDEILGGKIYGDAVSSYEKLTPGRKAILYAHSVEYAGKYADAFKAAGIASQSIDGKTPKAERATAIADFKAGRIKVLCNADLISEGFNVPDCDVVIMCRPTASLVLYLQQSMRCMRYLDGKQAVIIDHVGNYMRFGLPDADREWKLSGKKRSTMVDAPDIYTCEACYQVFYAWEDNHCPYCGAEKPAPDPNTEQGRKEIEQAEMIAIATAEPDPVHDTASVEFRRLKARKTLNMGDIHYPINAALRSRSMANGGKIRKREIVELARVADTSVAFLMRLVKKYRLKVLQ